MDAHFSVIMPTYNQASFIRRAILSLYQQTFQNWELIIINDGCTDETEMFLADFLNDTKNVYIKNETNQGLGYALTQGLDVAKFDLIAYLPSDDFYFENHLATIIEKFYEYDDMILVYTGMKYDSSDTLYYTNNTESRGLRKGNCLQLVQTAHRKTDKRWMERSEWVTEDLFSMFWYKLTDQGVFGMTNEISCNWTSHPAQRHRLVGERYGGGLNKYRGYYQVHGPIKMKISKFKFIDEEKLYANFQNEQCFCKAPLKILLLGELAYNPERIYAFEQAGHKLYGLWVPNPVFSFSTVGPLPFGHVEDIPLENWEEKIKKINPDIIYGMLNFGAVPLAYDVIKACPHIPFVWHFKEGPSICLHQGTWNKLVYLYTHASGKIYLNKMVKMWFEQFLPSTSGVSFIMDGDLPKKEYFKDQFSPKLSEKDGAVHTVVAGRMIGISGDDLVTFANNNIHIHWYAENCHNSITKDNLLRYQKAPRHFHFHSHVAAENWVKELSQYDAGWLHCIQSRNNGNLLNASWDDLNIPARISTYAAAGLPVIMYDNKKHIVATQDLAQKMGIGVFFNNYIELCSVLKNKTKIKELTNNMLEQREKFTFDYYVPQLIQLFRDIIKK